MLDDYIAIISAFGRRTSDENYVYYYHSWEMMMSTTIIARLVKRSVNTVRKKLDEMENFGIIEKVHTERNVTLWKLNPHKTYGDFLGIAFAKLTGVKEEEKEVQHLWTRP